MLADFSSITVNSGIRGHVLRLLDAAPGTSNKERIGWVARTLKLSFERVFNYKYNRVCRIDAHEADQIRHYALLEKRERLARMEAHARILRTELAAEAALLSETPEIFTAALPDPPGEGRDRAARKEPSSHPTK